MWLDSNAAKKLTQFIFKPNDTCWICGIQKNGRTSFHDYIRPANPTLRINFVK